MILKSAGKAFIAKRQVFAFLAMIFHFFKLWFHETCSVDVNRVCKEVSSKRLYTTDFI